MSNDLWKRDPLPDNLTGLHTTPIDSQSVHAKIHSGKDRKDAFRRVLAVIQHVASTVLFVGLFIHTYLSTLFLNVPCRLLNFKDTISTSTIAYIVIAVYCLGTVTIAYKHNMWTAAHTLSSGFLLGVILFALAPILKALTRSTADDSIWTLSGLLLLLNAALADYQTPAKFDRDQTVALSSALSLNGAVSASVVLASRLDSNHSVVLFLNLALAWFLILPAILSVLPLFLSTAILVLSGQALLYPMSKAAAIFYTLAIAIISLLAPLALIWAQGFHRKEAAQWALPRL